MSQLNDRRFLFTYFTRQLSDSVNLGNFNVRFKQGIRQMASSKNYEQFLKTLGGESPPQHWNDTLKALWWDARGNWKAAHDLVDGSRAEHADWRHAYLHRKEGDKWNAGYWYRRATRPYPEISLEEELMDLVEFIMEN
jgi:hypothetical protein